MNRGAGRKRRLWGVLFLLLIPCGLLGWAVAARTAEESVLRRASAQLEHGSLERALQIVEPLRQNRFLSPGGRRRAAALLFQLGKDREAHGMLRGLKFHSGDPGDMRLRTLSARCQQAAIFLKRADAARDPAERLRWVGQAREELPDAPNVLQRLVKEEVLAMTRGNDPAAEAAFEQDYADLRRRAPAHADAVQREVRELLQGQTAVQ